MVKIKTKKQLTLPQLIEWGFEKGAHGVQFKSDRGKRVGFRYMGYFWTEYEIDKGELFTIEVEEEITEDTILDKLVVKYRNDDIYIFPQERINDFKNDSSIVAFYIPNDDLTLTLIWKDGKLIE